MSDIEFNPLQPEAFGTKPQLNQSKVGDAKSVDLKPVVFVLITTLIGLIIHQQTMRRTFEKNTLDELNCKKVR